MSLNQIKVLMVMAICPLMAMADDWDKLWRPAGQGLYDQAELVSIQFGEYLSYRDEMPVTFSVDQGAFQFSGEGILKVSNERADGSFFKDCSEEGAAWISYFQSLVGDRKAPKKRKVHANIKGVEIACGRYVYPIQDLRLTFSDPVAQKEWSTRFESKDKENRDKMASNRLEEQLWRERVRENTGTYTDPRDGQVYRTIKIDGRVWLAQNMQFDVEGKSWCYDDKDSFCSRGGRLYNLDGARKACPKGWHLPRDREFTEMLTNLTRCYSGVHTCSDFGKKLKAKVGWDGEKGSDEYGFSVYSTGFRDPKGKYQGMGSYSGFWTNQSGRVETNYVWVLEKDAGNMQRIFAPSKEHGYAVRCVEGD